MYVMYECMYVCKSQPYNITRYLRREDFLNNHIVFIQSEGQILVKTVQFFQVINFDFNATSLCYQTI